MNTPAAHFHFGWQLTGRCNLRCAHCLRQRHDKPAHELSPEERRLVLADYIAFLKARGFAGSIQFSGGNPMLVPDIWDLLKMAGDAQKAGFVESYHILGNPETLTPQNVGLLWEYGCDQFVISLDGATEATNDTQRGPGNYRAALWAIKAVTDAGVEVSIKYTLTNRNYREVATAAELCRTLGARRFVIGSLNQHDDQLDLSPLRLTAAQEQAVAALLDAHNAAVADPCHAIHWRGGHGASGWHTPAPPYPFNGNGNRIGCVVWEDGSVHRRNMHPSPAIGHVPQESFRQLYDQLKRNETTDEVPAMPG